MPGSLGQLLPVGIAPEVQLPLQLPVMELVAYAGGPITIPDLVVVVLAVAEPDEPEAVIVEVGPEEEAHASFSRTENWVEYWNSPVPSTMISMP